MRIALLTLMLAAAGSAQADAELQRCAQIAEAGARLACYDQLAAQRKNAPPPAPVAAAKPAAPAPSPEAAFGKQAKTPAAELDVIESRINGRFEGWGAKTVFTLANGQRWAVSDGSRGVVFLDSPKVRVRRGMMGSFFIEFEGTNATARVRRLE